MEITLEEIGLLKRSLELFMEETKKDCEEMPLALSLHKKLTEFSGPPVLVVDEDQIAKWTNPL